MDYTDIYLQVEYTLNELSMIASKSNSKSIYFKIKDLDIKVLSFFGLQNEFSFDYSIEPLNNEILIPDYQ